MGLTLDYFFSDPLLSYETSLLEQMSLTDIYEFFESFLCEYMTNLGASLPKGRTWKELALELHGASEENFFLISILSDMIKNGVKSQWTN